MTFNIPGTQLYMYGIIPPTNSSDADNQPSATYTISNNVNQTTQGHSSLPITRTCQRNALFFQTSGLSGDTHVLTINVTSASPAEPFILDYAYLCGGPTQEQQDNTNTSTHPNHGGSLRRIDGIIIGIVLGAFFFLVACAVGVWLCVRRRRRRRARLRQLRIAASPVISWLSAQSSEWNPGLWRKRS